MPVAEVLDDVVGSVFHHPALRSGRSELHANMFGAVEGWVRARSDGGAGLDVLLGSESVRAGRNHISVPGQAQGHGNAPHGHGYGGGGSGGGGGPLSALGSVGNILPSGVQGGISELQHVAGNVAGKLGGLSHGFLGGGKRDGGGY